MATITGTTGNDTLLGTAGDDTLLALGGSDLLAGGDGADEYALTQRSYSGSSPGPSLAVIDDSGTDGAVDVITGGRGLYASASFGYQAWASAERIGDELVIFLPGQPYRFHNPGSTSLTVEVKGHYAGNTVEFLVAGGVTYALATGTTGTAVADILAGSASAETFLAADGNDFIDAGAGDDRIVAGAGNDVAFGDAGADEVLAGAGNDTVFGGDGDDSIGGASGQDWIETGEGANVVRAGSGNDIVYAGTGNDSLDGGNGWDVLTGFDGNDTLSGGRDGDTYRFGYNRAALGTTDVWGHDTIDERGNRPAWDPSIGPWGAISNDTLEFFGLYGPSDGSIGAAMAALRIDRIGGDMVIARLDGLSSVTVTGQFTGGERSWVEFARFDGAYWGPIDFTIRGTGHDTIGDDRGGFSVGNELLFGGAGADRIFGDSGLNLIWTGAGADTLVYTESDPVASVWDIVMDFDVARDRLDFTEIEGLVLADLAISADADGDAVIGWNSGDIDIANIAIELRGVTAAEITAGLFVFG